MDTEELELAGGTKFVLEVEQDPGSEGWGICLVISNQTLEPSPEDLPVNFDVKFPERHLPDAWCSRKLLVWTVGQKHIRLDVCPDPVGILQKVASRLISQIVKLEISLSENKESVELVLSEGPWQSAADLPLEKCLWFVKPTTGLLEE